MQQLLIKQDWVIGAVYRMAARRKLDRANAVRLLMGRAKLSELKAEQLAYHWFSGPLRVKAQTK